jgi:beta-lactamase class D
LPDLNGFWLGASLKISPIEQVQALPVQRHKPPFCCVFPPFSS